MTVGKVNRDFCRKLTLKLTLISMGSLIIHKNRRFLRPVCGTMLQNCSGLAFPRASMLFVRRC